MIAHDSRKLNIFCTRRAINNALEKSSKMHREKKILLYWKKKNYNCFHFLGIMVKVTNF